MRKKTKTLIALAAVYAAGGATNGSMALTADTERAVNLLLSVLTAIAVYIWCRTDSLERGTNTGIPVWAAIFPPIGVPWYFIRTRGRLAGIRSTGKAIALYVILVAISLAFAAVSGAAGGA